MRTRVLTRIAGGLIALAACAPALAGTPVVRFNGCTEFVGVAPVDATKARALVPTRYSLITDADGAKLVVRVTGCNAVRVGNLPAKSARIAQIGIMIVSPDGTGTDPNTAINNYTLTYATDLPALALSLRATGVPAIVDSGLEYEFSSATAPAELYAAVSAPLELAPRWFLHGSVNPPTFGTTFLANWWLLDRSRQIKMETVFPTIAFDFASVVSFTTSRSNVIGRLLQSNRIEKFPLSFRGAYDAATMTVETTF